MEHDVQISPENKEGELRNSDTNNKSSEHIEIINITRESSNSSLVTSSSSQISNASENITVILEENEIRYQVEAEDYKGLYEECQLKLAEQSEKFQKRVIQLTNDFNGLKEQNDELILSREKCKAECET